jgi:L-ascorbate metabolism protein UlaG (beta-lactamase superfamily)
MEILFYWVGGATFILSIGNLKIACDPVICEKGRIQDYSFFKSKRMEAPVYDEKTFNDIDLWLITHNHEDHLDSIGLSKIDNKSMVISNPNASKIISKTGTTNLTVLKWNMTKTYHIKGFDISVEAVPAIHGVSPLSALFAGVGNGYYLTISKGDKKIRIYITGDTVYKRKVVKKLKGKEIDLMIPNMGAAKQHSWIMILTLNAKMLNKMMSKLNPKYVIPVHYGTFEHYIEPVSEIEKLKNDHIKLVKTGDSILLNFNY